MYRDFMVSNKVEEKKAKGQPDVEFTDEQNNSSDVLFETENLLESSRENNKDSELLEVEVSTSSSDIKKALPEFELNNMSLDNIVNTVQSLSEEPNKLSEDEEANLHVYLTDKGGEQELKRCFDELKIELKSEFKSEFKKIRFAVDPWYSAIGTHTKTEKGKFVKERGVEILFPL
ncbi:9414_t:CDS:2, partial [Acaulospora morrowiae]